MYTLRTVHSNGNYTDALIGEVYTHIERFVDYDTFSDYFQSHFEIPHVADGDENSNEYTQNCVSFISTEYGKLIPIYKGKEYYIMHPSGATFNNITFKEK